jgi:hypothetical protein
MPQLTGWDLTCAVVLMTVATFCLECLITAIKNRPRPRASSPYT